MNDSQTRDDECRSFRRRQFSKILNTSHSIMFQRVRQTHIIWMIHLSIHPHPPPTDRQSKSPEQQLKIVFLGCRLDGTMFHSKGILSEIDTNPSQESWSSCLLMTESRWWEEKSRTLCGDQNVYPIYKIPFFDSEQNKTLWNINKIFILLLPASRTRILCCV